MASYHLRALSGDTQELTGTGRHIAVAGAVEAIATNAVLLVQLVRNGIHECLGRHGLMEGGVKHTHLGQARHQFLHGIHALQVGGIMQRGQVRTLLKGLQHLIGQYD